MSGTTSNERLKDSLTPTISCAISSLLRGGPAAAVRARRRPDFSCSAFLSASKILLTALSPRFTLSCSAARSPEHPCSPGP